MNDRKLMQLRLPADVKGWLAAEADAAADTPVMAAFRVWQAAQEAEDAAYIADLPDAEVDPFCEARRAAENA